MDIVGLIGASARTTWLQNPRSWDLLSLGSIRLDRHDHIAGWGSQPSGELVPGTGCPKLEGASLNGWPAPRYKFTRRSGGETCNQTIDRLRSQVSLP